MILLKGFSSFLFTFLSPFSRLLARFSSSFVSLQQKSSFSSLLCLFFPLLGSTTDESLFFLPESTPRLDLFVAGCLVFQPHSELSPRKLHRPLAPEYLSASPTEITSSTSSGDRRLKPLDLHSQPESSSPPESSRVLVSLLFFQGRWLKEAICLADDPGRRADGN